MIIDLAQIRGVVLDMDGVLWRGNDPLPAIPALFDFFDAQQIPYIFATNNSTRSPEAYVNRLARFGITATTDQILTSATVTATYLRQHHPSATCVYMIGDSGLKEALIAQQFELLENADSQAELVVVGLDRQVTYEKLRYATYHIYGGALFIGTNGDRNFPEEGGKIAPGAGSLLAAIEAATGITPQVMGKPSAPIFEQALVYLATTPAQTLMIGDRLETDILGAQQIGMPTVFVLTGISPHSDIEKMRIYPSMVVKDLSILLQQWPS